MMARKPEGPGKDERAARLAAALKQNLKRRKEQARSRASSGDREPPAGPTDRPTEGQKR